MTLLERPVNGKNDQLKKINKSRFKFIKEDEGMRASNPVQEDTRV